MQRLFGVQLSLRRNTLLMSGGLLLCTHTSTTDPLLLLLAPIRAGPCSPPLLLLQSDYRCSTDWWTEGGTLVPFACPDEGHGGWRGVEQRAGGVGGSDSAITSR